MNERINEWKMNEVEEMIIILCVKSPTHYTDSDSRVVCTERLFTFGWRLHHHDPRRSWARKNCNTYYECFTRSSSSSLYTQKWRVRNQNKSTRISYIFSFDGIYKRVGAAFRDFLLLSRPHICCLRRVSNEHEMKLCVYNFFSPSIHASILGSPLHQLSELARLLCFTFFYDTRLNLLWSIFFCDCFIEGAEKIFLMNLLFDDEIFSRWNLKSL